MTTTIRRLVWFVPGALILLALPLLKYSQWWWELARPEKRALAVAAGVYGLACLLALIESDHGWRSMARVAARGLAVLGLGLFALAMLNVDMPRYLLLPLVALLAIAVPLVVSPGWLPRAAAAVLTIAALGAVAVAGVRLREQGEQTQSVQRTFAKTAFYTVDVASREGWIPPPATRGGGLDRLDRERVLLGTGDGYLYLLNVPVQGEMQVTKLDTRVPHNRDEFAAAFGGSSRAPTRSSEYSEAGPPRVQTWRFRVADVVTRREGDRLQIFASHHFWNAADGCFVVRVSQIDANAADPAAGIAQAQWRTIYETHPCVPLTGPQRKRGKNPFKGEEVGGRLAWRDGQTLLLTLGDQGFSGLESLQAFAQDPDASYGKTILIDLPSGEARTFTMGHRNPQGLFVDPDGRVWESEHGAQGGDEINLLTQDTNYGWPNVTYGTDYGSTVWPRSAAQGRHPGYREPVYAFVPSIGASQIIRLRGDAFQLWRSDLLIGSLSTRSLYRIVLDGERAVVVEPIALNKRVRDLLELDDGRILVWTDDAAIVSLEPARGNDGASLFAAQCSGCHSLEDGLSHRLGPDLGGVFGRGIASATGFDEYSAALRAQQGSWTDERLDAFLRNPQEAVPGNSMGFAGIPDAEQRRKIIEHLRTARPRK